MDLSQSDWKYIDERAGSFVGREWVFAQARSFLSGPPGTFVLRGDPGTGKTAVAARLMQASRGRASADGFPAQPPISQGTISAAVFCRAGKMSVLELIQQLSDQLADSIDGFAGERLATLVPQINIGDVNVTTGNVAAGGKVTGLNLVLPSNDDERAFNIGVAWPLRRLREAGANQSIVILVDAVDEAVAPNKANTLSRLLGNLDGVHLIVTCRADARVLFDFRDAQRELDLIADAPPDAHDVRDYLRGRLRGRGPEGAIATVVDRIAAEAAGNFLYAFYVTGTLIQSESLAGLDQRAVRSLQLPTGGLPGVYAAFLDRQIAGEDTRWTEEWRPVLAPLCAALGDGFTTEQLGEIASRLTGRSFSKTKARDITRAAAQFLDGQFADGPFRVYHQSFARFLTDPQQNPSWPIDLTETNDAIVHALIDAVPLAEQGEKDWAAASTYVRRHLSAHAGRAAVLDELIADPGFVLACDLGRLLAVLDQVRTEEGQTIAEVIERAAAYLERDTTDDASHLQMIGRQYGAAAFADHVGRIRGRPLPWSTRWAHVMPRTPHRVLGHHDGPATAITSLELPDGTQVAISAGDDGIIRVWNLSPGGAAYKPLATGVHVRSITPLPGRDGRPGLLVLDQERRCTWWGLTDTTPLPLDLDGHEPCGCVTVLDRDGVSTVALGCGSKIVEYDIERRGVVRSIDLASYGTGRPVQVTGIIALKVPAGGFPLVAALSSRRIALVDLTDGGAVDLLTSDGRKDPAEGSLLAAAHVNGQGIALVKGGRDVQIWDLDLRARIGYMLLGDIHGCGTMADGRPVVLATDLDGMFGAWDLSDLIASSRPQKADELTDRILQALPELPAGPAEGAETLSSEQVAQAVHDAPASLGLRGPVRAIAAIAEADGRSATVAYAGPGDLRIWPTKPSPPDPGPTVFATNRGPLPGLPAAVLDVINKENNRIDTWILPPPPGRGQHLLGHTGRVRAATLTAPTASSDCALSIGDDGTVRFWRLQLDSGVRHGLDEWSQRPSALVTADAGELGPVVITGCVDGQLRIWSARDGNAIGKPLTGNGYAVRSLATMDTSIGTYVAALHQNRKLRIWNLASREMFTEITPVEAFAFTIVADSRPGVSVRTSFEALQIYNLASSQWIGDRIPWAGERRNPILDVGFADGHKLILAESNQLKMLDVKSVEAGEIASIVLAETNETFQLEFLESGKGVPCLIEINSSGVSILKGFGNSQLARYPLLADSGPWPSPPDLLATGRLPDGTAVAVLSLSSEHEFCCVDPDDLIPFGLIAADSAIGALGVSADGTVIVATESGLLSIIPGTSRTPLPSQPRTPVATTSDQSALSELAATQKAPRRRCDLASITAAAVDTFVKASGASALSVERRLSKVEVIANPKQLQDMITQLLTYAARCVPAGGRLLLEAGPDEQQAIVRVSNAAADDPGDKWLDLYISDMEDVTNLLMACDGEPQFGCGPGSQFTISLSRA